MKSLSAINEWTAKRCGVTTDVLIYSEYGGESYDYFFYIGEKCEENEYDYKWTIEDARCREIIRERFKIDTLRRGNKWGAYSGVIDTASIRPSKTIVEAEIACITEIFNRGVE